VNTEQELIIKEMRSEMRQLGSDFIAGKITYSQYKQKMGESTDKASNKWDQTNADQEKKTTEKVSVK